MPTILRIRGWKLFFYSDERNEPVHIHAEKAGAACKYWLHEDILEIEEAWSYGLTPAMRREVRGIIFQHFADIVAAWQEYFGV